MTVQFGNVYHATPGSGWKADELARHLHERKGGRVAVGSVVSERIAALTEGVLTTMFVTKLKAAASVVMLLAMFGFSGGFFILKAHGDIDERAHPPGRSRALVEQLAGLPPAAGEILWQGRPELRSHRNPALVQEPGHHRRAAPGGTHDNKGRGGPDIAVEQCQGRGDGGWRHCYTRW